MWLLSVSIPCQLLKESNDAKLVLQRLYLKLRPAQACYENTTLVSFVNGLGTVFVELTFAKNIFIEDEMGSHFRMVISIQLL